MRAMYLSLLNASHEKMIGFYDRLGNLRADAYEYFIDVRRSTNKQLRCLVCTEVKKLHSTCVESERGMT